MAIPKRIRQPGVTHRWQGIHLSMEEREIISRAADSLGQGYREFIKRAAVEEAKRLLLSFSWRPHRLRVGAMIWKVVKMPEDELGVPEVAPYRPATGMERVWIAAEAFNLPEVLDPNGRGWAIDIVEEGAGFLVARDEILYVGTPSFFPWLPGTAAERIAVEGKEPQG